MNPYDATSHPTQSTSVEFVTPARARALLAQNQGNRRASGVVVARWRNLITLGRYRLTHQGIALDEDGALVDGQHRLIALASLDIPGLWMSVSYGVARSGFAVMDVGHRRQAGQLIPGPHANEKAAIARMLFDFPHVRIANESGDNERILATYEALAPSIDLAMELSAAAHPGSRIGKSLHGLLLTVAIASEADAAVIQGWVDGVGTGAGLDMGDPRLAVRNRWAAEQGQLNSISKGARRHGLFLLIRGWNAWVGGERMTRLQLPRGMNVAADDIPDIAT